MEAKVLIVNLAEGGDNFVDARIPSCVIMLGSHVTRPSLKSITQSPVLFFVRGFFFAFP
jgi:hypothetical protein